MAFLVKAAGLEPHGRLSEAPLAYTHLDIGGSGVEGGDWQHGRPTAAPILAWAEAWLRG
jgi:leucyl aminopeptidase